MSHSTSLELDPDAGPPPTEVQRERRANVAPPSLLDLGGTLRSRAPEDTWRIAQELFERCGITRVADVTGLDEIGIPVCVCIRPNAKNLSVAQGKGTTRLLASLSAAMEGIEDAFSESPREADLVGTIDELGKRRFVGPNELSPGAWDGVIRRDTPLEWLVAEDLARSSDVLVPRFAVNLDTTGRRPWDAGVEVSSTGLASGNDRDEAICHALFEIIERDANSRWLSQEPAVRAELEIDVVTIDDENADLVRRMHDAAIVVRVWDITSDLGIPTFRCTIQDRATLRGLGVFGGMGTHASRRIALSRALTEASQSRLTIISGARDDVLPPEYERMAARAPDVLDSRSSAGERVQRSYAGSASLAVPTSAAALRDLLVRRLRARGHDCVAVVDHLREPLAVVHVLVPGMRDAVH